MFEVAHSDIDKQLCMRLYLFIYKVENKEENYTKIPSRR